MVLIIHICAHLNLILLQIARTPAYNVETATDEKCKQLLGDNQPLRDAEFTTEEVEQINDRCRNQLLTVKPVVYVVNLSQKDIVRKKNKYLPKIKAWIEEHGGGLMIPFSVEFEQNRWDAREDPAALASFMEDKAGSHMLPKIIKQGFKQLNIGSSILPTAQFVKSTSIPQR